jgi:hypothetical protein
MFRVRARFRPAAPISHKAADRRFLPVEPMEIGFGHVGGGSTGDERVGLQTWKSNFLRVILVAKVFGRDRFGRFGA